MSDRLRLFVAVSLPEGHLDLVAAATEPLRALWPRARWTDPANQHVTLKFLGSTPSELLDEVTGVVRRSAERHRVAKLSLDGLGVFPSPGRARVLWIGLDDPEHALTGLAEDLARGFEPLGFEAEKRPFHSHLTLARFREPERIREVLPEPAVEGLPPFEIGSVELFRSHLHPRGARYEVIESFPLGRG